MNNKVNCYTKVNIFENLNIFIFLIKYSLINLRDKSLLFRIKVLCILYLKNKTKYNNMTKIKTQSPIAKNVGHHSNMAKELKNDLQSPK